MIAGRESASNIAVSPGTWRVKLTCERVIYVSHHIW
jgi:hypothetical protein